MFRKYRKLEQQHVQQLVNWALSSPDNMAQFTSHNGAKTEQQIRDYLGEYSYKFAIAPLLAGDVGYPEVDRMWKEINPYRELENEMD